MKKLLFICLITFGAAAAVNAQDTTSTQRDNTYRTQDAYTDKDAISPSELPANIREQLQGQDYASWTVSKAFRKMKNGQTVYAVELTNGTDKKKVKFDANGNVMKEKEKKDNQ